MQICKYLGDRERKSAALNNLGLIAFTEKKYQDAIKLYQESLASADGSLPVEDAKARHNLVDAYNAWAQRCYEQKQNKISIILFWKALKFLHTIDPQFRTPSQQESDSSQEVKIRYRLGNAYNSLARYWYDQGKYRKATKLFEQALKCLDTSDEQVEEDKVLFFEKLNGKANALLGLGNVYHSIGNYKDANQKYEEALEIFQRISNQIGEAKAWLGLGKTYHSLGHCSQAITYLDEKALQLFINSKDLEGEASALDNLGKVYQSQGQYSPASDNYLQALKIRLKIKDRAGKANSLNNLSNVYHVLGKNKLSFNFCKKALKIFQEIGGQAGEATSLNNLGNAYHNQGQLQESVEQYNQALKIFHKIRERAGKGSSLYTLGSVHHTLEEYQQAIKFYKQALRILNAIGHREFEAKTLFGLGNTYDALKEYEKAINLYKEAWPIFRDIGNRDKVTQIQRHQGNAYNKVGQRYYYHKEYLSAIASYKQALKIFEDISAQEEKTITLHQLRDAFSALGQDDYERQRYQNAIDNYQQSLSISHQLHDLSNKTKFQRHLINAYNAKGQDHYDRREYKEAEESYQLALESLDNIDTDFPNDNDSITKVQIQRKLGSIYKELGNNYYKQKEYKSAVYFYDRALNFFRIIDDSLRINADLEGKTTALLGLGNAWYFLEQDQTGFDFYKQGLNILQGMGHCEFKAKALCDLGDAYYALKQYQNAIDLYKQSLNTSYELGDLPNKTNTQRNLRNAYNAIAQYHYEREEYEEFKKSYQLALELSRDIDSNFHNVSDSATEAQIQRDIGTTYKKLGDNYYKQKKYHKAIELYLKALNFFNSIDTHFRINEDSKQETEIKQVIYDSFWLIIRRLLEQVLSKFTPKIVFFIGSFLLVLLFIMLMRSLGDFPLRPNLTPQATPNPKPTTKSTPAPQATPNPTQPNFRVLDSSGYRVLCPYFRRDIKALNVHKRPIFSPQEVISSIPCNTPGVQIIDKRGVYSDGGYWVAVRYKGIQGWM